MLIPFFWLAMRRPTLESNYSSGSNRNSSSSRPTIETNLPKPEQSSLTSTLKSKFSRKSSLLGTVGLGAGSSPSDRFNGMGTAGRGRSGSDATVRTNATGANAGRSGLGPGPGGYEQTERNSYDIGRGGAVSLGLCLLTIRTRKTHIAPSIAKWRDSSFRRRWLHSPTREPRPSAMGKSWGSS
jgi:hypothetical protein